MEGPCYEKGRKFGGWTALVIGAAIGIAGFTAGNVLKNMNIPDINAAPQILDHMPGFAVAISIGLVACGALLLANKTSLALLALCVPLCLGEAHNSAGFAAFDPVRSSKRMVAALGPKVGERLHLGYGRLAGNRLARRDVFLSRRR